MVLLIDGYNLLFQTGLVPRRPGPVGLHRARLTMIARLGEFLPADVAVKTVVVFDAKRIPIDAIEQRSAHGIEIRYAVGYEDADELIVELIRGNSAPKRLTVVSSDRAVQQAARRRRAQAVDSQQWWDRLLRHEFSSTSNRADQSDDDEKPAPPVSPTELQKWRKMFEDG